MSEAKQLPKREELAQASTWDLTKIFPNDEAFEAALADVTTELVKVDNYRGTLANGARAFYEALEFINELTRKFEPYMCIPF